MTLLLTSPRCTRRGARRRRRWRTSSSDEAIYAGFLFKKGGGTSTLGRRTWKPRYFEVRQRVLYYYANEAAARQGQARGSIYLSSATLVIGQQDVTKREYKHYFEVP